MKITCMLDSKKYQEKPSAYETGIIQNRMTKVDISLEDLAKRIIDGQTFKPAELNGTTKESWQSQQLYALDFDKGTTIEEELNHCKELGILPVFGYTTFSHSEKQDKFRLVFCNNEIIRDKEFNDKLLILLVKLLFPKSDPKPCDSGRLFYGGRELFEVDYNMRIDVRKIFDRYVDKYTDYMGKLGACKSACEGVPNILNNYNNSPNIIGTPKDNEKMTALRNRDVEYLKSTLCRKPLLFTDASSFWQYVYHELDIGELIGINYPKSFCCVLHKDSKPSASIFKSDDGVFLYKCHTECCPVMNIKQLIEYIACFKSEHKAIEFMKDIYNLKIEESEWCIEQKNNLDRISKYILLGEFADFCPTTSSNLSYQTKLFLTLVEIAKDNVYSEQLTDNDGNVAFFAGLGYIAKLMETSPSSTKRISQRIAALVYHGLLKKLDDDEIPETLLKKSRAIQIDNKSRKHINFYSIPSWVMKHIQYMEKQGEKWRENGYTMKGVSYEMFCRSEGIEVAQRIYPQFKKVTVQEVDYETGEIIGKKIIDRQASPLSDDRVEMICKEMDLGISQRGFVTEKEIIEALKYKLSSNIVEKQLKKIRGELKKLGYERIRAVKGVKESMNIEVKGAPFIIVSSKCNLCAESISA